MEGDLAEEKEPANETREPNQTSMNQMDEDEKVSTNDENSFSGDEEHHFEECIRDLCMMRKSMPHKCSQLLEDYYDIVTPNFEKYRARSTEDSNELIFNNEDFQKGVAKLKEQAEKWNSMQPLKLHSLEERCTRLIELGSIRKGMGLDRTQELLFSGKRKAEDIGDNETEANAPKCLPEADHDIASSPVTPELHTKRGKLQGSSSLIPRLKKDAITPVTPIARSTSLRQNLLKKSVGKT